MTNREVFIKKVSIIILLLICTISVFYYSWLPHSNLKTETYLPQWIINWGNEYINLRTAVPFVALGFLLEIWTSISMKSKNKTNSFIRLKTIKISMFIVCLAEGGQFFIADRHPDFMDIVFGILGSLVGVILFGLIRVLIRPSVH